MSSEFFKYCRGVLIIGIMLLATPGAADDQPLSQTKSRPDRTPRLMIQLDQNSGFHPGEKSHIPLSQGSGLQTLSPGYVIGTTAHDCQHIGSMGRQIYHDGINDFIFWTWTGMHVFLAPDDMHIRCQAFDNSFSNPDYNVHLVVDSGGYNVTAEDPAGFVTCDGISGNGASFACHTDPGTGLFNSRWYYDWTPLIFFFNNVPLTAHPDSTWYQNEFAWPIMASHLSDSSGVTEDMVYVLSHVYAGSGDLILYRIVGEAGSWPSAWDSGQYIETCANLSYTIVADPNSDRVAIVYTDDRAGLGEGEGGHVDLDVYYMLSNDQGDTWSDPINISNYHQEDSLWRAYTDLSALFATDGTFHVIWVARELYSPTSFNSYQCRLVHWDDDYQHQSIIDEARYEVTLIPDTLCHPGAWNLYIAKPSLSECNNNLYALYTKFGDENEPDAIYDCSRSFYANGELYLAASYGGYSWDEPQNLTQTRTDACYSSECESDHWSSMIRYGIEYAGSNDSLDIIYINDKDAGSAIHGEGTWCENPVMHLRTSCRDVDNVGRLSTNAGAWGLEVLGMSPSNFLLKLENIGTQIVLCSLDVIYHYGFDWIDVPQEPILIYECSYEYADLIFLAMPDLPDTLIVCAEILIRGSAAECPITIPVTWRDPIAYKDTTVNGIADYWQLPGMPTCWKVAVTNCLWYWDHHGYPGLIPHSAGDPGEWEADGQAVIAELERRAEKGWTKAAPNYIKDKGHHWEKGKKDGLVVVEYTNAGNDTVATYSLFVNELKRCQDVIPYFMGIDSNGFWIDWYHAQTGAGWDRRKRPTQVALTNGWTNRYGEQAENPTVVAKENYDICTINDPWTNGDLLQVVESPVDGIPPDGAAYIEMLTMMTICPLGKDDRAPSGDGIIVRKPDKRGMMEYSYCIVNEYDTLLPVEPIYAFGVVINAPFDFGSLNVQYPDDWYAEEWIPANTPGLVSRPPGISSPDNLDTTGPDWRGVVWITNSAPVMPGDSLCGFSFDFSDEYDTSYTGSYMAMSSTIEDSGRILIHGFTAGPIFICDCGPGDANGDGMINVADAVYLINYIFKDGPPPTPYQVCSGDANCDCVCNVADAVYIINYVFKDGPPPCACEEWSANCGRLLRK